MCTYIHHRPFSSFFRIKQLARCFFIPFIAWRSNFLASLIKASHVITWRIANSRLISCMIYAFVFDFTRTYAIWSISIFFSSHQHVNNRLFSIQLDGDSRTATRGMHVEEDAAFCNSFLIQFPLIIFIIFAYFIICDLRRWIDEKFGRLEKLSWEKFSCFTVGRRNWRALIGSLWVKDQSQDSFSSFGI